MQLPQLTAAVATEQICDRVREDLALKKVRFPRSLQFASLTKCARAREVRAAACGGGWQAICLPLHSGWL